MFLWTTFFLLKALPEVAMCLPEVTATANVNNFIDAMKVTKEEINNVALATKHQSEAPDWFKYKVGRMTASNAKRVYTCYQTLEEIRYLC